MYLEHLTYIHSGRHAHRVEDDVERSSVRKERHILGRKYSRNDALVSVAARHLVADRNLTLLSDIDTDDLVHSGRKLILILSRKDLDVDDDTRFAVRQSH